MPDTPSEDDATDRPPPPEPPPQRDKAEEALGDYLADRDPRGGDGPREPHEVDRPEPGRVEAQSATDRPGTEPDRPSTEPDRPGTEPDRPGTEPDPDRSAPPSDRADDPTDPASIPRSDTTSIPYAVADNPDTPPDVERDEPRNPYSVPSSDFGPSDRRTVAGEEVRDDRNARDEVARRAGEGDEAVATATAGTHDVAETNAEFVHSETRTPSEMTGDHPEPVSDVIAGAWLMGGVVAAGVANECRQVWRWAHDRWAD